MYSVLKQNRIPIDIFIEQIVRNNSILNGSYTHRFHSLNYRAEVFLNRLEMFAKEEPKNIVLIGFNPHNIDVKAYPMGVSAVQNPKYEIFIENRSAPRIDMTTRNNQDFISVFKLDYNKSEMYNYMTMNLSHVERFKGVLSDDMYKPEVQVYWAGFMTYIFALRIEGEMCVIRC